MPMATKRNAEGYQDPTAYQAIKNIEQAERRSNMEIKRGDIYYIDSIYTTGSEQRGGRPAIIVSNEKNNQHSATVEIVYLTTQPKNDLPTHVTIRSSTRESIALCEQVHTVSTDRIGSYKGHITDAEQANIDVALLISLDLSTGKPIEKVVEKIVEVPKEVIKEVRAEAPVPAESSTGGTVGSRKGACRHDSKVRDASGYVRRIAVQSPWRFRTVMEVLA